jgi:Mrp family chromosome partitioning ATPase
VLGALRRRWLLAAACLIIVSAVSYGLSTRKQKEYSASAVLLFGDQSVPAQVLGISGSGSSGSSSHETTDAQLVSLEIVQERTNALLARRLGARYRPAKLSISAGSESNIATVSATSTIPRLAALTANTYAEEYIALRKKAERGRFTAAERTIKAEIAKFQRSGTSASELSTLSNAEENLKILAALQTGGAQLVQPAVLPAAANGTSLTRNVTLGVLLGIALGIVAALVVDRLDRRLREPREVAALVPWPLLGSLPKSRRLRRHRQVAVLAGPVGEAIRTIRVNLRYLGVKRRASSVAVVSVSEGDGGTTVGYQLAAMAASLGSRALYVESDLRRPSSAAKLGIDVSVNLADVLSGQAGIAEAIYSVVLTSDQSDQGVVTLKVMPAPAAPVPNPVELLESAQLKELVRQVGEDYEFVVFDVTPLEMAADAYPILVSVDGVVAVVRVGNTIRSAAIALCRRLEDLEITVFGVVVNGAKGAQAIPSATSIRSPVTGHADESSGWGPEDGRASEVQQPSPASRFQ